MYGSSYLQPQARPWPMTHPQCIELQIQLGEQDQPAVVVQYALQVIENLLLPVAAGLS